MHTEFILLSARLRLRFISSDLIDCMLKFGPIRNAIASKHYNRVIALELSDSGNSLLAISQILLNNSWTGDWLLQDLRLE